MYTVVDAGVRIYQIMAYITAFSVSMEQMIKANVLWHHAEMYCGIM